MSQTIADVTQSFFILINVDSNGHQEYNYNNYQSVAKRNRESHTDW